MKDRILKIATTIMNGLKINAPCTCGEQDHAPGCAYEVAVDGAWDYSVRQAEEIAQDVELHDVA